jgi:hypothetical protein
MNQYGEVDLSCISTSSVLIMLLLISEMYQAKRWHENRNFWTPMVITNDDIRIFVGDIIDFNVYSNGMNWTCTGKVTKFISQVSATYKHDLRQLLTTLQSQYRKAKKRSKLCYEKLLESQVIM